MSAAPFQLVVLLLLLAERGIELDRSAKHVRALLGRGAVEHGRRHYPWMVAAHLAFFASWTIEVWRTQPPADLWLAGWLAVFVLAQAARFWVLDTLGERWSTRVLVLPGAALVGRGPYRWLRHPNYVVIVAELAALAIGFRAWWTLGVAALTQAVMLGVRIRVEERALARHRAKAPAEH